MAIANTSYTMNKLKADDNNYETWSVDIEAVLRRNKLLRYTQVKKEEDPSLKDTYDEKVANAAIHITLTTADDIAITKAFTSS